MKKLLPFAFLLFLIAITSCSSNSADSKASNVESKEQEVLQKPENQVIAWVDNLNIREQPNIKSKVVAQAKEHDVLTLTGEKTDFSETISLRGQTYTEPWVKVKTAAGIEGWAFQGAIRRPGEDKGTALNPETIPTTDILGTFGFSDCDEKVIGDGGCSCSFSTGDRFKGPTVFLTNMAESACVKINGQMQVMQFKEIDMQKTLAQLSNSKNWITINQSGPILYFGKPLQSYGYDNGIEFLTDVILASGKTIPDIPIENKSEGMAIREVRDMAKDAIANAKTLRAKGFGDSLQYLTYGNGSYEVTVRTRRMTNYEGEADHYDGVLMLWAKDGDTPLDTKVVKGNCGC